MRADDHQHLARGVKDQAPDRDDVGGCVLETRCPWFEVEVDFAISLSSPRCSDEVGFHAARSRFERYCSRSGRRKGMDAPMLGRLDTMLHVADKEGFIGH